MKEEKRTLKELAKQIAKAEKAYKKARKARKSLRAAYKKAMQEEGERRAALVALQLHWDGIAQENVAPEPPAPETSELPATSAPAAAATGPTHSLRALPGLGPKMEGLLQQAGVFTLAQLAQLPTAQWEQILHAAGPRFRSFDPGPWQAEAARLAGLASPTAKRSRSKKKSD